jgi:hypothetical protein
VAKVNDLNTGGSTDVGQISRRRLAERSGHPRRLGFVLTSVAGGLIAHYFQVRTAERNRREAEKQAAATVFDEISRAMDRRLYRMWLWHWALKSGDGNRIDKALNEYRTVLTEWNDSLNRNLVLTYRYFGERVGKYVNRALYEEFARIGRLLEGRYRDMQRVEVNDHRGPRVRRRGPCRQRPSSANTRDL